MPIGVFDSGLGGLTVLAALQERMPDQAFVYLGDAANAPYGTRDAIDITNLTIAGVQRLFDEGCDLVILACNTASAVALRPMQEYFVPADRRVLGVLVPMVEAVAGRGWMEQGTPGLPSYARVAFFGTPATVASNAFAREVRLRAQGVNILQIACPGLVDALEAGAKEKAEGLARGFARQARDRMPDAEAMVLGCTHYPLAAQAFVEDGPPEARQLSQASLVADSLVGYLERYPRFKEVGDTIYLTTGRVEAVTDAARIFLCSDPPVAFRRV